MSIQFLVIDLADAQQALSADELQVFTEFQNRIQQGRADRGLLPNPQYILCAAEEPYATLVGEVIRQGEAIKQAHQLIGVLNQQIVAAHQEKKPAQPSRELDLEETLDP